MKAIFTALFAVLCLTSTVSCKGDDDSGSPEITNADLVVGTWDMTSNTVDDGNATATVQGFPITANFTWEGKDYDYQLTFDEDNMVAEQGGFTVVLTYSAVGQSITEELPLQASDGSGDLLLAGEYTISENQLTVVNNGQVVTATIDELSETTLRLSIDLADLSPELAEGAVENARGTNKITFTKQ
ncbi:MAG: hypothetical protein WA951_08015 [Leeuwenhoekiella sp.]